MMTGLDPLNVELAVETAMRGQPGAQTMPEGYEVIDTSNRVVRFVISTALRHHAWAAVRTIEND
jgi:UDP-N-acetylglucosamine 2-epimerase (non-hydrolysing)